MPIVLIDQRTPKRATFDDAWIEYVEASADRVLAEIRRGYRRASGKPDEADAAGTDAAVRLCAEVVLDWGGIVDVNGAEVPWPAKGHAAGVEGHSAPSAADMAQRSALLRVLPWNVLARLDGLIASAWTGSAESGKDSTPGSGG